MTISAHGRRAHAPEKSRDHARSGQAPGRPDETDQELASDLTLDLAASRRNLFGMTTALWASHGEHAVEPGWFKAMSGLRGVNQNVVLCHGADPELITRSLDCMDSRVPGLIELAGPALGHAKLLSDAGMICIGSSAFMVLERMRDLSFDIDPEVTEAGPADLPAVWDVLSATFGYTPEMAQTAVPPDVFDTPGQSVWVLTADGRICSSLTTVIIDETLVAWSMATIPALQRHGYGRRLLETVLARAASQGVNEALLLASPAGEPLYTKIGYRVVEYWQQWSRSRWMWAFSTS